MRGIQAITVTFDDRTLTLEGRQAWALKELIAAGRTGCTPITNPGPRRSDYVFKLRRQVLAIETVSERHGGIYAGHHARYVLHTPVCVIEMQEAT